MLVTYRSHGILNMPGCVTIHYIHINLKSTGNLEKQRIAILIFENFR